jgi:hypothetical protein
VGGVVGTYRRKHEGDLSIIRYCTRCVMPKTKPDILFGEEGVCSACRHFSMRGSVDWDARRVELVELLERYRSKDGSNYDCVIPSAVAKDSTYQVVRMLELGMNPLCVTATTEKLSDIGRRNIENLRGRRLRRGHHHPCRPAEDQPTGAHAGGRLLLAGARRHLHHPGPGGGPEPGSAARLRARTARTSTAALPWRPRAAR